MNKNINRIHQCSQCKNSFPEQELYRIGIKQKDFFCRECAKNIKSECMWCGRKCERKWKSRGSELRSGNLEETIDHDNLKGDRHYHYYLTCPETKEHGIRPNQSCPSRVNDFWVEKGNQKRQEKSSKGWKKCQGKALYYAADSQRGLNEFNMDCWKLVPPGEKYCKDEACIYFTAVYNGIHSEERKRIRKKWNQRTQEKYQKANEWWNSLSLIEKQIELKKEEKHLKNLGLQRQRCWIEKIDKNSILFENDKLYYDNMSKIPPSFLDRFGLPGFQWENVWKRERNHANTLQAVKLEEEISKKESLLEQSKETGDNESAAKLEQQIQELINQQKVNFTDENPTKNNKTITYSIIGFSLLVLVGFAIILVKSKRKNPKIK